MTKTQTLEIFDVLKSLPSEKITEVRDFALFLRERYGKIEVVDESDEWTEEDLRDVAIASLRYADEFEDEAAAMKAGTIVTTNFPGVVSSKRRPAVVISSETYHQERPDVILALITTNIANATSSTDYVLQDWSSANLISPSAVRNIHEVSQSFHEVFI